MPYTQANPLDESVKKALDRKIGLLRKRNTQGDQTALYYYTSRTPWICLTSAVDVVGEAQRGNFNISTPSQLAREYKLTSAYNEKDLPAGHSNTSLGIRPRPGIQNMNVRSHNQFGSLRTAKVDFQVWSKEDLDACELLYMRPGMSVLLEWGWSIELTGEGTDTDPYGIQPMERGIDIFKERSGASLLTLLEDIGEKKFDTGYGYDAVFGYVKNFNWSLRADGGYDCWTEIVTPGEIIESVNLSYPVSNQDAQKYRDWRSGIIKKEESIMNTQADALDRSWWARGTDFVRNINTIGFDGAVAADQALEASRETLIDAFYDKIENLPNYETQTALATFIKTDIKQIFVSLINSTDNESILNTIVDWDLTNKGNDGSGANALYTERLFNQSKTDLDRYKTLRQINWIDQQVVVNSSGDKAIGDNDYYAYEDVVYKQHYIKYGLILEVLNRFILHSNGNPIISFDIENPTDFTSTALAFLSLDPSSCLLPSDMSKLVNSVTNFVASADTYSSQVDFTKITSTEIAEDKNRSILDIYLNVDMLDALIESTNVQNTTSDGVATSSLLNFVKGINTKINEACAGTVELDLQYFEDEGVYSIVDRVNFQDPSEKDYKVDLIGNESIFHSISLASSLTAQMSSAIAISVQSNFKAHNNTEAGFLRFNEGLADRVINERVPIGNFANSDPKEGFTLTQEDLNTVEELYNAVYGKAAWIPDSFRYAREIHHKYITEVLNETGNEKSLGKVIVPFSTTLTLDGTSGVKILSSLLLSPNLLPYTYSSMRGGVGVLVTGIEATVDASKWVTTLTGQYYPRESAPAINPVHDKIKNEDIATKGHILFEYADRANAADRTKYGNSLTGFITSDRQLFAGLNDFVEDHQKTYWLKDGTLIDEIDQAREAKQDGRANILEEYWKAAGKGWSPDLTYPANRYVPINEAHVNIPWSAVYVTYILNNYNKTLYPIVTTPSHYLYCLAGIEKLEGGQKKGWVAFSLIHDNVKAEAGDILVAARDSSGSRTASHGVIVHKVNFRDGQKKAVAIVAGGNEGNRPGEDKGGRNKIDREVALIPVTVQGPNGTNRILAMYPKGSKEFNSFVIVLKYYG